MNQYPIIKITEPAQTPETTGGKYKFWFEREGNKFLYKEGRPGTGENWAEVLASRIAELLGLPNVRYEFAESKTGIVKFGVVSERFLPINPYGELFLGNVILPMWDPNYPVNPDPKLRHRFVWHKLEAISALLQTVEKPFEEELPPGLENGLDVFIGYLLLDCLIGNTDRHHENWGVIYIANLESEKKIFLAPTFDHASSLGRELKDDARKVRLTTRDINRSLETYASKALSAIYIEGASKPMPTIEAYKSFAKISNNAARIWQNKLERLNSEDFEKIASSMPSELMSSLAKEFVIRLLCVNQRRILEV